MTELESAVARHYAVNDLLQRIMAGLERAGADLSRLAPEDLAPVDEFHIGGRPATAHAVAKMSLRADHRVLDIGCGIGGATRFIAGTVGCRVTGIDLTPEYIATAKTLAEMTGLDRLIAYDIGNALSLPCDDRAFDAAITLHVAMNIRDRATLYREAARVLKPGAALCVYDVMKVGPDDLAFPVPWAQSPETSHLTTPQETQAFLREAGFRIQEVEDRTEFAHEFFRKMQAATADGPPPLGVHLLMGSSAPEKIRNMVENLEKSRIAPVQIIARKKPT